jgi:D-alanine-D-alanine ligase
MKKITVGILCGGKSAEHEVSMRSARNIAHALDPKKYDTLFIKIEKNGAWLPQSSGAFLENSSPHVSTSTELVALPDRPMLGKIDVVFPVLHGPNGEDGTVQGLLKVAGIPFVGAGVLGSAVGMDKDVMKRLLREAGIPTSRSVTLFPASKISCASVEKELGLPLFIKPANMGSSVGISKVNSEKEFIEALKEAFQFDTKVLVEECIFGREIECSVLGDQALGEVVTASIPAEIIPEDGFYSYDEKYSSTSVTKIDLPPKNISDETIQDIQNLAIKTFNTLACSGMGRVDFFLEKNGRIVVNEINTIPGFTEISMYPKMWEKSGIKTPDLLDRLIELALKRHKAETALKTSYLS